MRRTTYFFTDFNFKGRSIRFIKPDTGLSAHNTLNREHTTGTLDRMLELQRFLEKSEKNICVIIKYGNDTFYDGDERLSQEERQAFFQEHLHADHVYDWKKGVLEEYR